MEELTCNICHTFPVSHRLHPEALDPATYRHPHRKRLSSTVSEAVGVEEEPPQSPVALEALRQGLAVCRGGTVGMNTSPGQSRETLQGIPALWPLQNQQQVDGMAMWGKGLLLNELSMTNCKKRLNLNYAITESSKINDSGGLFHCCLFFIGSVSDLRRAYAVAQPHP